MTQPKIVAMICLSVILSPGCSFFPSTKESVENTVDPEVETIPEPQRPVIPRTTQIRLEFPFDKSWQATLEVFQRSGYTIRAADQRDGWIRTEDKPFSGPSYPWRESYSVQIIPAKETGTLIRVKRQVKVYWHFLVVGPRVWMTKSSNGKREAMLLEKITQRLTASGVQSREN